MNNNNTKTASQLFGEALAKGCLATLMAFIITTYGTPLWLSALLIFLIT
jgi:hypothetical protein